MTAATGIVLILVLAVCFVEKAQSEVSDKHSAKTKLEAHLTKVCEDDSARGEACKCMRKTIEEAEAFLVSEKFADVQDCIENSEIGKKILTKSDLENLVFVATGDNEANDIRKMVKDKTDECCGLNERDMSKRSADAQGSYASTHPKFVAFENCLKTLTEEDRRVAIGKLGGTDCFNFAQAFTES